MAHSPATPAKANTGGSGLPSNVAILSLGQVNPTSAIQQSSVHEPSPASTYGETAGSRSVPATPQEHRSTSATAALEQSLLAMKLDASIERNAMASGGRSKSHASPEHRTGIVHAFPNTVSPASTASAAAFGSRHNASVHSSPTSTRIQDILESPNWRQRGGFVRQSAGANDDPFVSGAVAAQPSSPANDQTFHPREDRAGVRLSGDNAQAVLPPNACIFVANLVSSKSDDQLEYSVHEAFRVFGNCYVKIRRDNKGMPFAFCQYEHVSDAQRAITCGRGTHIDGRPCRTEVAKVNRSLYLSKVTGEPIPEAEAREIMGRYGALERVWFCTATDKEMFRLPEGVWIMFAFFQDCRDAQTGFRDHHLYRLEQPRMPDEMRARLANRGIESPSSSQPLASPGYPRRPFMSPQNSRRPIDYNSIFVGNLPPHVDEHLMRNTFGAYGRIRNIEIVRKPSINPSGKNIFAFVEYYEHEEAAFAIQQTVTMQGVRLRVEQKESIDQYNRRDLAMMSGGSPRERYFGETQDALAMLFQRGVSVGMANAVASQAQALSPPGYGAAAYPYYPSFNPTQYGQYFNPTAVPFEGEPQSSLQMHGNLYMPNGIGQMQYARPPPPYVQYTQVAQSAPRPTDYRWPPANDSNTEATASSAANDIDSQ